MSTKNLAIACQGGGSHCAFGAGVLAELLNQLEPDNTLVRNGERYRITALTGTSGGAINAVLAWLGLTHPAGPQIGRHALIDFWHDLSAKTLPDMVGNFFTVQAQRLREILPHVESAPNLASQIGQQRILQLLHQHVPFAQLPSMIGPHTPRLLLGAANVLSGNFKVFEAGPTRVPKPEEILASTAVPSLYKAVEVDGKYYWDGLLSQNPPVRNLLAGCCLEDKPDAIWLIRINPQEHTGVPRRLADITDRQNEMAGNLSLLQEMLFIRSVNKWVREGTLTGDFKHVEWHEIELEAKSTDGDTLDYASKLDRDPVFIEGLFALGREEARAFLAA